MLTPQNDRSLYYIYDGECPLCKFAAQAYRVKSAVGEIHLLNAREELSHPIIIEATNMKINLDDATAVQYAGKFYCGAEALTLMAVLSTGNGWFNRCNALLMRNHRLARICYPLLRAIRNALLFIRGKAPIGNLKL
ncbi:MAG: pyrrolo-quinoline quinone [Hyphomonadaceae bacterium]|nr:MAG: pyrrolo-quinoline quinone [Hyphomonadaceae bacterium]KAF0187002.1 MAG: pyrrolo-quinoline quinone [Hyphomonadaceae bacterium]